MAGLGAASAALADDAAAGPNQIEEVVVTATKRPELLKDVPIALSAFGQKELEQREARDLISLQTALPNVSLVSSGASLLINPIIRGVSSNTRNVGVESGLAVYVDGVYTGRPETFNVGLEDARTVEILRGPQGTLFGKNAIAGALSVTTQDPTSEFGGRIGVDYGSEDHLHASGTLNVPLAGDRAGVRLTLYRDVRDGFVKNLFDGKTIGNDDYWGGRVKALFKLTDSLDLTLTADRRHDDRRTYIGETRFGQAPTVRPFPQPIVAPGPFTINEDHLERETRTLSGVSATLTYRTASGFTLSAITAHRSTRRDFEQDDDSSPADAVFNHHFDKQGQFTQELRVVSPGDARLKYAAGLYYYSQDSYSRHLGGLGVDFAIPGLVPGGVTKVVVPLGVVDTKSYAAYADGSYRIVGKLDLLAGLRITRETKDVTFSVTPDPLILPLFYEIPRQDDHIADTDVSPTVGLRYQPTDDLTTYLRVARGYKSGGWNVDFIGRAANRPAPTIRDLRFQPEKVTNYEVGFKGAFLDRRARLNLAAFYMDYKDLQVTQFFGLAGGAVTSNAASATIKGFEGDITAVVTPGLTLGGTLGYSDARYDHFANADATGARADGKRLPGPKTTASVNATYEFALPVAPGNFTAFAEYSYRGAGFVSPLNESRLRVPERSLVNARLTWAVKNWRASAYVENLFNKRYLDNVIDDPFSAGPQELVNYGRPRTGGLSLTALF